MITAAYNRKERAEILSALQSVSLYYSQFFPSHHVRAIILDDLVAAALRGLTWSRDRQVERADSYSATWHHFQTHPHIYGGSTPMMIERFQKLQDEAGKEVRRINKLGRKVKSLNRLFEVKRSDLPRHPNFHYLDTTPLGTLPAPLPPQTN